ncbi:unnamed protein product [Adineta steineri]|uniref:Uncharacterized protein n=1 Tax=Adineta steineri TaxID=433720 RepID=A0A814Q5R7_9BILA|nr:unnamed protein product [Adineta steineri]CAF3657458.1 unnamed protein product [Adineta steineri]
MQSKFVLSLLVLGLLACFLAETSARRLSASYEHNDEDFDTRQISIDCTARCTWWNACMWNGGSCPEPDDCDCRHFAKP